MRFWIVATLSVLLATAPAYANIGRVKSASGGALVERGGEKIVLKPGVVIETGDIIVTPVKGRLGLTFVDNTRLAAGPGSRITIRTFDYDDTTQRGRFLADIAKGQVAIISGLIANSGPDAMQIRTPKSLFAVRGARIVARVK